MLGPGSPIQSTATVGLTGAWVPVVTPKSPSPRLTARVLHVINGEHFSGAERVQQLLGRRLPAHGVAVDFAMCKSGKFASHCGLPPESLHDFAMRSRFDRRGVERIAELHAATPYSLLHAHTPRTALVASLASRATGLPWVYHVHSPTARDSERRFRNWANAIVERRSLIRCDAVLTVSESLKAEMLRRGVPSAKVRVVPNGVEPQTPIETAQRLCRSRWRFGAVALFRPRKGLEILLEAFDSLCGSYCPPAGAADADRVPPYELQVIGGFESPAYEAEIRQRLERMRHRDRVTLEGFVADAPARMRELDWLVLPSLYGEGMPMVVLEAMAVGVPVVATAVEGTPEVVRDGLEGILAKPQDVASLAAALGKATESRGPWAAASRAAARRQQERFSDAAMAAGVATVYAELLGIRS